MMRTQVKRQVLKEQITTNALAAEPRRPALVGHPLYQIAIKPPAVPLTKGPRTADAGATVPQQSFVWSLEDDVFTLLAAQFFPLKSGPWSQNRLKHFLWEKNKTKQVHRSIYQQYAKGTVLTSCGTPSRITCNQNIPGTKPWYVLVHPKKKKMKKTKT